MKKLISLVVFLAVGQTAQAETVLTCKMKDQATFLTLEEVQVGNDSSYLLQLIDPAALTPLAGLKMWGSAVKSGASLLTVDHFESRVGDLQLVVVFPVGGGKSKHVYFQAGFRRDKNTSGSFGLKALESASASEWTCEQ